MSIPIAGAAYLTQSEFTAYVKMLNPHDRYLAVIPIYYELGPAYGIVADGALLQAAKETNWGRYGGVVPPENHNWCGLKTAQGGSNTDPNAHMKFDDDRTGIHAHYQHLAAYAGLKLPAGTTLVDPRYGLVNQGSATTFAALGGLYAPSKSYGTDIEAMISAARKSGGGTTNMANLRIIISAGHEHIGQITADKIGASSQANLRNSTGALGREAEWTGPWADALVARLTTLGVDAVRTDAIYHADVYSRDADLMVVGHCDGTGTKRAQWCMAGAVISGGSTDAADAKAKQFAALWTQVYPTITHIPANGPITDDMTYEYEGWYRTPNTPAVLIEHFILGNGGVWSNDLSPQQGADADAQVIAQFFNLNIATPQQTASAERVDPVTGFKIIGGIRAYIEALEAEVGPEKALMLIGRPLTNEYDTDYGRAQDFQRQRLEWHKDARPQDFDILPGLVNKELIEAKAELAKLKAA